MSEDFSQNREIVDRCNLYCTGKLLQNFDMQKWGKKKKRIPNSPDFEGKKIQITRLCSR